MSTIALAMGLSFLSSGLCAPTSAQTAEQTDEVAVEEPDETRLDVERLPPEAIEITRDLYAHGFFVEATLGGRGFIGGVGELSSPGPWARVSLGLEIVDFLHLVISAEGSMHQTDAPPPPGTTAFELLGATAALRLQANFTSQFAMWLSGEFGLLIASTDILQIYGIQAASDLGMTYGGELGIDWHFRSRHTSLGLLGGVRHYPSLEGGSDDGIALGVHSSLYLRYVF